MNIKKDAIKYMKASDESKVNKIEIRIADNGYIISFEKSVEVYYSLAETLDRLQNICNNYGTLNTYEEY